MQQRSGSFSHGGVVLDPNVRIADLHIHLGSAVPPSIMWQIAHEQGIKLQAGNGKPLSYWDFFNSVTVDPQSSEQFEEYLRHFDLTERIQSSPMAIETCMYHAIGTAYRNSNVTLIEPRFNPMKRNNGGVNDLDGIIAAAERGKERAVHDYPEVEAGIIIMLDRTFDFKLNQILVEKAIKHKDRGVIGIDIGGPYRRGFSYSDYSELFKNARAAGLGTTVHAGEDEDFQSVITVVESLSPDRIGHGIKATQSEVAMELLLANGVTLEVCPMSNLNTGVVENWEEMARIFEALKSNGVKFTLNTDGPKMLRTSIGDQNELLISKGILSVSDIAEANKQSLVASFLRS